MLNIVICDDDEDVLGTLTERIEAEFVDLDFSVSVHPYSSVRKLTKDMEMTSFDVFFLDIDMPEISGVDFGLHLREHGADICIIFISNREERVFDTFKVDPLRFIRKAKFFDEIEESVRAVISWWERRRDRHLVISSRGDVISILVDDILYVECLDKTQNIVLPSQTISVKCTLSELEEKLCSHNFLKPHKGYLVNYRHIDYIKGMNLVLQNGVSIPISKYKALEIKKAYMKLVSKEMNVSAPHIIAP